MRLIGAAILAAALFGASTAAAKRGPAATVGTPIRGKAAQVVLRQADLIRGGTEKAGWYEAGPDFVHKEYFPATWWPSRLTLKFNGPKERIAAVQVKMMKEATRLGLQVTASKVTRPLLVHRFRDRNLSIEAETNNPPPKQLAKLQRLATFASAVAAGSE